MVSLEVHPIDESQIPIIVELAKEIWLPTFKPFFTAFELQSLFEGMYGTEELRNWFALEGNQMFTIGPKYLPVGYFAIAEKIDEFWLDKIYIHPKTQGSGLGFNTWLWVKEAAKEKGYQKVWLRVNRRNQQAIDFYLKVGFKIDSSVDFEGPNGFVYDDYVMEYAVL